MTRNAEVDHELPYLIFDFLIDAAHEGSITQEEAIWLYHKWGFGLIQAAQGSEGAQASNETAQDPNAA